MRSSRFSRASARRAGLWSGAILTLLAAALSSARAGGPVFVTTKGQPFRRGASQPFRYAVDLGPFGSRTHAAAVALVARAFQIWQQVSTARFQVEAAGELTRDITAKNVMAFLDGLQEDDASPILFDTDGTMSNLLFGSGAAEEILGIGVPDLYDEQSGEIFVSFAVLNGHLDSRFSDNFVLGNFTHELGHCAGMAHSQVNAEVKYDGDPGNDGLAPTMFYRGPNDGGALQRDDIAWFSWLYPSADFASGTGTIRGRVLLPDGTGLEGIHVVARRMGDPQVSAVSAVSGFLFDNPAGGVSDPARLGEFLIPGLPPGSYTVELQELDSFPSIPVPAGYLVGGPKFWREGSSAHDPPTASTPIVVSAGQAVSGIDVFVNGDTLGEPRPVTAQHPNALPNAQSVKLPAVISGSIEGAASAGPPEDGPGPDTAGPPINHDADLQDVYQVTLGDWTVVTAILSAPDNGADLDLYVLGQSGSQRVLEGASNRPGTPPEVVQLRLPPGKHYFGIHRSGAQGSAYTLRLLATPAPDPVQDPDFAEIDYLLISDVTPSSAAVRWQTSGDAPSVLWYNQPVREIGSTTRRQQHSLALPGLASGTRTQVVASAQAGPSLGQLDQVMAPLTTATSPAPGGAPRIVTQSSVVPLGIPELAEVQVRLSNPGDGDALKVRIEQVVLSPGWDYASKAIFGTQLPGQYDLGQIGAGGAGAFVVRLVLSSGSASPKVTLHGTYTDAAGTPFRF